MKKGERAYEVVVVGAGVIGLSIAFEVAASGRRVLVVEKGRPGCGASAAAGGMLAPAAESEVADEHLIRLALESHALYDDFIDRIEELSGVDCGYRREGTLLLALDRDHRERFERAAAIQRNLAPFSSRETASMTWLDPREVRRREPKLAPRIAGAFFAESDHQVDPRALCEALHTAVVRLGGEVLHSAVIGERRQGGVEILQRGKRIDVACRTIVLANGVDSEPAYPGAPDLGLRPIKGQILCLHGEPLLQHVVRTPDVYLIPRRDGRLLVGVTSEDVGFDRRPTAGAVHDLLREAFRALPGILELELKETCVGFRPALRNRLPAIGWFDPATRRAAGGPRQLAALGHYRHGILLAPITAWLVVRLLDEGELPAAYAPFRPRSAE